MVTWVCKPIKFKTNGIFCHWHYLTENSDKMKVIQGKSAERPSTSCKLSMKTLIEKIKPSVPERVEFENWEESELMETFDFFRLSGSWSNDRNLKFVYWMLSYKYKTNDSVLEGKNQDSSLGKYLFKKLKRNRVKAKGTFWTVQPIRIPRQNSNPIFLYRRPFHYWKTLDWLVDGRNEDSQIWQKTTLKITRIGFFGMLELSRFKSKLKASFFLVNSLYEVHIQRAKSQKSRSECWMTFSNFKAVGW